MSIMETIETGGAPVESKDAWTRTQKPDMAYQCRNLDDVFSAVQYEIQTHSQGLIPEEVVCRLQFGLGASLDFPKAVEKANAGEGREVSAASETPIDPNPCPGYSVAAALSNFSESKDKLNYQRVVSKAILGAIQHADGFKYIERRAQDTSKSDGYRFGFICLDSLQNKDRIANKISKDGEAVRDAWVKPTFDCKGGLRVVFSVEHLWVDVFYHHLPIHDTVAELNKARKAKKENETEYVLHTDANGSGETQPQTDPDVNKPGMMWLNPLGLPPVLGPPPPAPPQQHGNSPEQAKKKAGRENKSYAAPVPHTNVPLSPQGTLSIDTLVDVLKADINGTMGVSAGPFAGPSAPGPHANGHAPKTASDQEKSTKRKRNNTGCLRCRDREIVCDGQRPTCVRCSKKNRCCSWAESPNKKNKKAMEKTVRESNTASLQSQSKAKSKSKAKTKS